MSLEDVFPQVALSPTEVELVAQALATPVVRKYLKSLAAEDAKELLSLSSHNSTPEQLALGHSRVQGKLQVVATLLSIEAPVSATQPV